MSYTRKDALHGRSLKLSLARARKIVTYLASLVVALLALPALSPASPVTAGFTNIAIDDPAFTQLFSWFDFGSTAPVQQRITSSPNVLHFQIPITTGDSSTGIYNLAGGVHFVGQATPKGVDSVLWLTNLVANSSTQLVTGDVAVNTGVPTTDVALFYNNAAGRLVLDDALASELSGEFGIPDLSGTQLGTLVIAPAPEPGTLALVGGTSLIVLALRRRRRA